MDAEAPRPDIGQRLLQLGLDVVEAALMVLETAAARMREPPDCGPRYYAAVAKLEQSLADYDAVGILNALYRLGHAARDGEALRLFQRGEKKRSRAGGQKRGENVRKVTPERAAEMSAYHDKQTPRNAVALTAKKFNVSRSTVLRYVKKSDST